MATVRVFSFLSLSILILHAWACQGENVEGAKSNCKEYVVKESGAIGRKMVVNCLKESYEGETTTMKVQSGTRKLQGTKNTLNVKDEQKNVGNLVPEEYVAFNADYRGPRHHPPKNN